MLTDSAAVLWTTSYRIGLRAAVIRSTDRAFARLVGGVLAGARAGSELIVDAHVIATAVEAGGGLVLTSDPADLVRLASTYRNVHVIDIT